MKWLLAVGACLVLSTHAASIVKRDAATSEFKLIGDAFRLWSGEELVQAFTITQNMAERMMNDLEKGKFPDFGKYVEQAEEESKQISNLEGKKAANKAYEKDWAARYAALDKDAAAFLVKQKNQLNNEMKEVFAKNMKAAFEGYTKLSEASKTSLSKQFPVTMRYVQFAEKIQAKLESQMKMFFEAKAGAA